MFVDYVQNGEGHGPVGSALQNCEFEHSLLRPYIDERGRKCVDVRTREYVKNSAGVLVPKYKKVRVQDLQQRGITNNVLNATTLRKEDWIRLDTAVIKAARQRLKAWTDLESANQYGGFNGMSKMTLEYEAMSDPGEAVVDMDGLSDARADTPLFKLRSIPLPITHSDFWYSRRRLAVSANSGMPLDTLMAEAAGRRVAETIEKTLIGTITGATYGTQSSGYGTHDGYSTVYGYTNLPSRITKTDLNTPTGSNPEAVMTDVLEMVASMESYGFYGPYVLYHSTGYSRYMNDDYFRSGSTSAVRSLRSRIMEIEGIKSISRLDYLTSGYQLILVQMTSDVARAINGMEISTVQWESQGGWRLNFKVMAIKVPQLMYDYNGVAAIVHGTTS